LCKNENPFEKWVYFKKIALVAEDAKQPILLYQKSMKFAKNKFINIFSRDKLGDLHGKNR